MSRPFFWLVFPSCFVFVLFLPVWWPLKRLVCLGLGSAPVRPLFSALPLLCQIVVGLVCWVFCSVELMALTWTVCRFCLFPPLFAVGLTSWSLTLCLLLDREFCCKRLIWNPSILCSLHKITATVCLRVTLERPGEFTWCRRSSFMNVSISYLSHRSALARMEWTSWTVGHLIAFSSCFINAQSVWIEEENANTQWVRTKWEKTAPPGVQAGSLAGAEC